MDLPVVEVLEGDGRLTGTLGALVLRYKDNTVNVGSGFDDATRAKFWKDKNNLLKNLWILILTKIRFLWFLIQLIYSLSQKSFFYIAF